MHASPNWRNGRFRNPMPLWTNYAAAMAAILDLNLHATPTQDLPVYHPTRAQLSSLPVSGLRATWLGHSTVLLDIDGTRILTDPVWSRRASPTAWAGPRRFHGPVLALDELPQLDAIVISHDHYDHLDRATIHRMKDWEVAFFVPLGVGARLSAWGIPKSRITELDWWESARIGSVDVVCTPARHASGRFLFDRDKTLWAGFAFLGDRHRAYFSGDTGYFPGLGEIGRRLGPFDLTLIEIGAYNQAWPDWHLGPEQALEAHVQVQGGALLPIHWGTFKLSSHGWTEPVERLLAAAAPAEVRVLVPRPGEPIEPEADPAPTRWWPALPWKTASEVPILATKDGLKPLAQH